MSFKLVLVMDVEDVDHAFNLFPGEADVIRRSRVVIPASSYGYSGQSPHKFFRIEAGIEASFPGEIVERFYGLIPLVECQIAAEEAILKVLTICDFELSGPSAFCA